MTCLDDNLVLAYVDETLPVDERTAVKQHLAECASCRGLVADVRRVMSKPNAVATALATAPAPSATHAPAQLPLVSPSLYARGAEIGRGGLGQIVRARDERTGRTVAIKEMRVESSDATVRFVREALVTARLQHPAIVPVYEVGRWPCGQPFYVMKLVTGRPLSDVIRDATELDARLGLVTHVIAVADALAYAHGERVIHRDLKPSNIMVGAHGDTVVIDWGLARRLDDGEPEPLPGSAAVAPGQTVAGSVLGTPAYMAPEQARGERVDERTDVYAIGAILYHVLDGRPPYADGERAPDPGQVIEQVRTAPPRSIASIVPGAPSDLVAIVERAMARCPVARYPTAAALADDLRRFATGQLVRAHRYTRSERLRRFAGRNRMTLAVSSLALLALAATGTISVGRVIAERDRARAAQHAEAGVRALAEQRRAEIAHQLAASYVERAQRELHDRQPGRALALLAEAHGSGDDNLRLRVLAEQAARALPAVVPLPLPRVEALISVGSHDSVISTGDDVIGWSPGGERWRVRLAGVSEFVRLDDQRVIAATPTGAVVIAAADGRELRRFGALPAPAAPHQPIALHLAARRWLALKAHAGVVEVWDMTTGRRTARLATDFTSGYVAVSPEGRRVAVTGSGPGAASRPAGLYDAVSGRRLASLCSADEPCAIVPPAAGDVLVLAGDITNRGGGAAAVVYDWSGRERFRIATRVAVRSVELAPAAGLVIALTENGEVVANDLATGRRRWTASSPMHGYGTVLDEHAGRLWAYGQDGHVVVLELATGTELGWWWLPVTEVVDLAVSGDGRIAAVADPTPRFFTWSPDIPPAAVLAPTQSRVTRAIWLDDRRVATGSEDGTITIHDVVIDRELARFRPHVAAVTTLQALPDDQLLGGFVDDTLIVWDLGRDRMARRLDGAGQRAEASPDGSRIVAARHDGRVRVYTVGPGAAPIELGWVERPPKRARWSPDGAWVAVIDSGGGVGLWRAADGVLARTLPSLPEGRSGGVDVAFSPDGQWLLAARYGEPALLAITGGADRRLVGGAADLRYAVSFSGNGRHVLTSESSGLLRVSSVATGEPVVQIENRALTIGALFDGDGRRVIAGAHDHTLRIYDATTGAELAEQGTPDAVYSLALSPGGDTALATTLGPAVVWRMPMGTIELDRLAVLARCGGYAVRDQIVVPAPPPAGCPQVVHAGPVSLPGRY